MRRTQRGAGLRARGRGEVPGGGGGARDDTDAAEAAARGLTVDAWTALRESGRRSALRGSACMHLVYKIAP
jgi:hypothetical protein